MRFDAPITYNSLTLNNIAATPSGAAMSGFRVDSWDPWAIETAEAMEKRALRDGYDAGDVYLGRRTVNMIVSVFGSTAGDFYDKTQDLLAAFSPTISYSTNSTLLGFLPFDYWQPTADISTWPVSTYAYGIPLRMYLRAASIRGQAVDRDNDGGVAAGGLSKRFTITLRAINPLKFSVSAASSTTSTYTNLGDSPAYPFISIAATSATGTWTGAINGAAWTVNVDGSKFTAAQALTNNVWLLDCASNILYGPTTSSVASLTTGEFKGYVPTDNDTGTPTYRFLVRRMDRLDANSTFPQLAVGANTVTTGGTLSPTQTGQWRHAFQ